MESNYTIRISTKGGIDKYPAKAHARRVAAKLGSKTAIILIKGEKTRDYMHSDQSRPFRQDRYFYYLTGSNDPGCWVTYNVRSDNLTLWLPPRDDSRAFFNGRAITPCEAIENYDIDDARYMDGCGSYCSLVDEISGTVQDGQCAVLEIPRGQPDDEQWQNVQADSFTVSLAAAMNACRAVKDEHEIALVRKAIEISTKAHIAILKSLPTLKSEAEVEAVYMHTCLAEKAKHQSYDPICGAGPNAAQLHYSDNLDDFGSSELLLVDAGAEWKCYASDITRTMPINPKNPGYWSSHQAKVLYGHVAKIQQGCIDMLKPGEKWSNVAWRAANMSCDALLQLGILKGERDEVFEAGTWSAFFPHGLGHHLGLEVHDVFPPPIETSGNKYTVSSDDLVNARNSWKLRKILNKVSKLTHASDIADASTAGLSIQPRPSNCTSESSSATTALRPSASRPSTEFAADDDARAIELAWREPPLTPGMILTIEPGLYFNRSILQESFLSHPDHAKYINRHALKCFYPVGGVRIEDDILITKHGHENLSMTPKGEEALQIIRAAAAAAADRA